MAVDGLLKKMVINNINTVVGNLTVGALGFDPSKAKQPEAFIKWAPVLYLLMPVIDSSIWLIAKLLYKYPGDRDQVEADPIARRKLAEELEKGVEQEIGGGYPRKQAGGDHGLRCGLCAGVSV